MLPGEVLLLLELLVLRLWHCHRGAVRQLRAAGKNQQRSALTQPLTLAESLRDFVDVHNLRVLPRAVLVKGERSRASASSCSRYDVDVHAIM